MSLDAEVGVVGVGTMGSMTLWQLARRGISAVGFEQFRIGHEFGAGSGESRQYRDTYLEDDVREIMAHATAEYRALEAESHLRLLAISGGLTIGNQNSPLITDLIERIEASGDCPQTLTADEATQRFPQHRLSQNDIAIWDDSTGIIQPERAIAAAATTAADRGATIVPHSRVEKIEPGRGNVAVHTKQRCWRFHKVIVTTGPWVWQTLPGYTPSHDIGRLVLTWFPTKHDLAFTPDAFPPFTRYVQDTKIYGMPNLSQGSVRIGLVGPRRIFHDPRRLTRHANREETDKITNIIAHWMRDIIPVVIRTGVHMDSYTPDGQPLIGSTHDNDVYVAAGFSGRGFKMAPVIGKILAELASTGKSSIDIHRWDPVRFA